MASPLTYSGVRAEKNRNDPTRYFLQVVTAGGLVRDVEISIVDLAELARSAVVLLAGAIREITNA
jgi:hypothetical protein